MVIPQILKLIGMISVHLSMCIISFNKAKHIIILIMEYGFYPLPLTESYSKRHLLAASSLNSTPFKGKKISALIKSGE